MSLFNVGNNNKVVTSQFDLQERRTQYKFGKGINVLRLGYEFGIWSVSARIGNFAVLGAPDVHTQETLPMWMLCNSTEETLLTSSGSYFGEFVMSSFTNVLKLLINYCMK